MSSRAFSTRERVMIKKEHGTGNASHSSLLVSSQQTYALIVRKLPMGFSPIDRDGMILEFNPALEKLTGYSKANVIDKSHFEIIHGSKDRNSCILFTCVFVRHSTAIAAETLLKKRGGAMILMCLLQQFPILLPCERLSILPKLIFYDKKEEVKTRRQNAKKA